MQGGHHHRAVRPAHIDRVQVMDAADQAAFAERPGAGHDRRRAIRRDLREQEADRPAPGVVARRIVRALGQGVGLGDADVPLVDQVGTLALVDVLGSVGGGACVAADAGEHPVGLGRILRSQLGAQGAAHALDDAERVVVALGHVPARRALQLSRLQVDGAVGLVAGRAGHRRRRKDLVGVEVVGAEVGGNGDGRRRRDGLLRRILRSDQSKCGDRHDDDFHAHGPFSRKH